MCCVPPALAEASSIGNRWSPIAPQFRQAAACGRDEQHQQQRPQWRLQRVFVGAVDSGQRAGGRADRRRRHQPASGGYPVPDARCARCHCAPASLCPIRLLLLHRLPRALQGAGQNLYSAVLVSSPDSDIIIRPAFYACQMLQMALGRGSRVLSRQARAADAGRPSHMSMGGSPWSGRRRDGRASRSWR